MYARVAYYVGDRKTLSEDKLEGLEDIILDSTKAQAVIESARMSMGKNKMRWLCMHHNRRVKDN